jgi:hypothetical protein
MSVGMSFIFSRTMAHNQIPPRNSDNDPDVKLFAMGFMAMRQLECHMAAGNPITESFQTVHVFADLHVNGFRSIHSPKRNFQRYLHCIPLFETLSTIVIVLSGQTINRLMHALLRIACTHQCEALRQSVFVFAETCRRFNTPHGNSDCGM